jgi:cation diffusion facilitator CzcD-associated flavoprotein CzcO
MSLAHDISKVAETPEHEAIIIGAGVSGIYQLYRLLKLGMKVTVLEAGDGPGGTWYWNRYPGCRFDSESWSYGYSFSKELLEEWDWSEHFAAQPETLKYLEHVVEKFDLKKHMQFGCKVETCVFDEDNNLWRVHLADGRELTTRLLITAIGMLSAPTMPKVPGIEDFKGQSFHTYYSPHEPVDYKGKRVGIIGTGATAVQIIPVIAPEVAELKVFQRRPNWCAPLHNSKISKQEMAKIRASYDEIFERCKQTPGGFIHGPDRRKFDEVSEEERLKFWEELYNSPGFGIWIGNFRDVLVDERVNAEFTRWVADKIRQRVKDPKVAEKLIPKDHGFGTRRVPMETGYYEAYNRDNVELIDLNEAPLERITETGIRTREAETGEEHDYELDIIIYATGFDAITGAFDRIDFVGTGGQHLRDKWHDGPVTYLGLQVAGFPNLITVAGPQGGSVATNFPRGIEEAVDWATDLIVHMRDHDLVRVEPTAEAEAQWYEHVKETYTYSLLPKAKSWFTGYNSNVEGHDKLRYTIYNGGSPKYRQWLQRIAGNDYEGFELE